MFHELAWSVHTDGSPTLVGRGIYTRAETRLPVQEDCVVSDGYGEEGIVTIKAGGVCQACRQQVRYLDRDHRVPKRFGGCDDGTHPDNIQYLCLDCHRRKSGLEQTLLEFFGETETVQEWFFLAFQNDRHKIDAFIGVLQTRLTHFREVLRVLESSPFQIVEKPE